MNLQLVFDLVQICHLKGIKHAVISPGSRNAALTIAFARHPNIKCYSVPDERSAAFIALGISLKTNTPTALICTSGSAALNYAPAVAEAYFNQVPLLVLSADRPPEWIGQRDGQTIFQENLFGSHVKKSFIFPSLAETANTKEQGHQIINEAINLCVNKGMGPVHINIPFREPFYPSTDNTYEYNQSLKAIEFTSDTSKDWIEELQEASKYSKILVVVGQSKVDPAIVEALNQLTTVYQIPVVADIISNGHDVKNIISSQDVFLKGYDKTDLQPDLLMTVGMSVISKNLKLYLRQFKPKTHWHVRNESVAPDTYKCLSKHIKTDANTFLNELNKVLVNNSIDSTFHASWQMINSATKIHIEQFSSSTFSDFNGYKKVLAALPIGSDLHLANSMAVRYTNAIGISSEQDIELYCNRGTSGIDGSNSTAVGTSLMSDRPTFLLTGDMAFLYDRNAFWHNHLPENLSIIVFNNHGGGIFRMIEGPSQQPELEEFFETKQRKDAKLLAEEFEFEYFACYNEVELDQNLTTFMVRGKRKLLEIFTDAEESKQAYKELFRNLSK